VIVRTGSACGDAKANLVMKCALIIPPWKPEEIFPARTAAAQINYWQPLGTLYVASSLQKAGHAVKFLNGAFLPY